MSYTSKHNLKPDENQVFHNSRETSLGEDLRKPERNGENPAGAKNLGMPSSRWSSFRESLTPFLAIMQADLISLFKRKITYGWLIAALFLTVIRVLRASPFGSLLTTSFLITEGLSDFIYIWSMIIIGLSASTIVSETGEFADSIMSKPVKRYEYILAKYSSRIIYVTAIYAIITLILVGASIKVSRNDYETIGLVSSILFVALTLIMLTTIGIALSTAIPNTAVSIIVLLGLWYAIPIVLPMIDLEFLSPANLLNWLPNVIQGIWNGEEWKTAIGLASISLASTLLSTLYFSQKDL